jgi:hypothetical protein
VRRTRVGLVERSGRSALLGRRSWAPPSASSALHRRAVQTDWETVGPYTCNPLAAAAQSAESAAAAAIDAAETSRQRWEADMKLAQDLAARLEMAAQEIRHNFDISTDQSKLQSSWRSEEHQAPVRSVHSSSSTDQTTGTCAAASLPGAESLRRTPAMGQRPQTLRSNPFPALGGNAKSLAARAASPNNASLFLGKHSNCRAQLPNSCDAFQCRAMPGSSLTYSTHCAEW